jgi:hypothetical protein
VNSTLLIFVIATEIVELAHGLREHIPWYVVRAGPDEMPGVEATGAAFTSHLRSLSQRSLKRPTHFLEQVAVCHA